MSRPLSGRAGRFRVALALVTVLVPVALGAQPRGSEDGQPRTDVTSDRPHHPGELYMAVFGGYTFGHGFQNVQGTRGIEGLPLPSVGQSNSGVFGGKIGYFLPDRFDWLGVEAEVFDTTPHLKQSPLGPGGHLDVTTLTFNVVARAQLQCRLRTNPTRAGSTTARPGTAPSFCPLQPYAGVGLGVFFAFLTGGLAEGRSNTDHVIPGFNGFAGLRWFVHEHVALFGEYKYQRARFGFDHVVATDAGIRGDYAVSQIVGGVSIHF